MAGVTGVLPVIIQEVIQKGRSSHLQNKVTVVSSGEPAKKVLRRSPLENGKENKECGKQ